MTEADLHEDRVLRNAAKRLVKHSFSRVRGDMSSRSLGSRALERARDGAAEMAENSADFVAENKGKLGTGVLIGVAAFVGWLFRDQLADAVYNLVHRGEDPLDELADKVSATAEQVADDARSLID